MLAFRTMSNVAGTSHGHASASAPVTASAPPSTPPSSTPPSGPSNLSGTLGVDPMSLPILVVDDEADNLDAFRFNFKKSFRILSAQSGTEGLAILQKERVAVVVTDQRMP